MEKMRHQQGSSCFGTPHTPIAMALGAGLLAGAACAEVITGQEPDTGRLFWTWTRDGVSVQLVQLVPDQTRAFFLARGFGTKDADRIGLSCVFQTVFRNDGARPVEYDLSAWSVLHRSGRLSLRTREAWEPEWLARGIDEEARIAFRWALLPTVQRFEPGDYNWGMTSFGLPPGERFDLSLSVRIGAEPLAGDIASVVCPAERQ